MLFSGWWLLSRPIVYFYKLSNVAKESLWEFTNSVNIPTKNCQANILSVIKAVLCAQLFRCSFCVLFCVHAFIHAYVWKKVVCGLIFILTMREKYNYRRHDIRPNIKHECKCELLKDQPIHQYCMISVLLFAYRKTESCSLPRNCDQGVLWLCLRDVTQMNLGNVKIFA